MEFTIYHNPRCSKSRAALALLREHGVELEVVEYLQTPLSPATLRALLKKLGVKPLEIIRQGETEYKPYATKNLSDADWIVAIAAHPILLERPIVVRGNRAVVGRPPEAVLQLFD